VPANRDRNMLFQKSMAGRNKPTATDDAASTPNNKRLKQSYGRFKRSSYGEEEEVKAPAKRDRQMAINNWRDVTDKPVPLSRMKSQENRFRKRLYGKNK